MMGLRLHRVQRSLFKAAAHTLRKVSQVRVVTSLPKLRSITAMNTGPLGPGT